MKFSAVKHHFKPLSEAAVRTLVQKHSTSKRGEQSVYLDEVGIDVVAREVVRKSERKPSPANQKLHFCLTSLSSRANSVVKPHEREKPRSTTRAEEVRCQ